jgi:hypothetical protein
LSNRVGSFDTKALTAAWSRFETVAIAVINALYRRAIVIAPRALRILSSTKLYLVGIPLALGIPAAGVFLGLKLAHNPLFANDKSPLVDAFVGVGFFLVGAFFKSVRWLGLLGAVAIAVFLGLTIVLLCARLIGANVLALFKRDPKPPEADSDSSDQAEVEDLENTTRATSTASSAGTMR